MQSKMILIGLLSSLHATIVASVRTPTCDRTLGYPKLADCQNALGQMPTNSLQQTFGNGLGKYPSDNDEGAWVYRVGQCVISVNMDGRILTSWNLVRYYTEQVLDSCVQQSGIGGSYIINTSVNPRVKPGKMYIWVWNFAFEPLEIVETGMAAAGQCDTSPTCETAASDQQLCLNGACTSSTKCGDPGCSCIPYSSGPNERDPMLKFGKCGSLTLKMKDKKRSLIDEHGAVAEGLLSQGCLCNSSFTHPECCSGGKAVGGMLEL